MSPIRTSDADAVTDRLMRRLEDTARQQTSGGGLQPTHDNESADIGSVDLTAPRIPGYEIIREIGRGGMGVVYYANRQSTGTPVALKVMSKGQFADDRSRLRFDRELDLAAKLRHPSIVAVVDGNVTPDGVAYLAMNLIEGLPLDEYVRGDVFGGEPPKPLQVVLHLFIRIAEAVQYAHSKGVIHRDLKPANILVDADGEPHLLDFGVAKVLDQGVTMTKTGEFLGTLAYASPEQASGLSSETDARSDIYSLGVMLYEALTGRMPFKTNSGMGELLKAIMEQDPEPMRPIVSDTQPNKLAPANRYEIDNSLNAIVMRAMMREKNQRYATMLDLAEDLERYVSGEEVNAKPPSLRFLAKRWLQRNFRASFWTAVIGSVTGLAAGAFLAQSVAPRLFSDIGQAYAEFPSLGAPLLSRFQASPHPTLLLVGGIMAAVLFFGMGLLTELLVRPKTTTGTLSAGLMTGVIAGIVACLSGAGWVINSEMIAKPLEADFRLVADAVAGEHVGASAGGFMYVEQPAEPPPPFVAGGVSMTGSNAAQTRLLDAYPDLGVKAEGQRPPIVLRKVHADVLSGSFWGAWLSLLLPIGLAAPVSIVGAWAAAHLKAQPVHLDQKVVPYLEMTLPAQLGFVALAAAFLLNSAHATSSPISFVVPLAILGLGFVSFVAVTAGASWPTRWVGYIAGLILFVRCVGRPMPLYVEMIAYAGAAFLIVTSIRYLRQTSAQRQIAERVLGVK